MSRGRDRKLTPRNGHTLVAAIVARISGCAKQKEVSLDDQVDHGKQEVAELYEGPVEYRVFATKGKGERRDRTELRDIQKMLRSSEVDVMVMEDVGRLVRGTEASYLWGIAVDHGTRCLAPHDYIDTADDNWEEDLISACRDHVGHNSHTSKRQKHKLMNRFKKFGGAMALPTFGYIVPAGVKTYDEWVKDEKATPFLLQGFQILKATQNCSAVADHFNREKVPTGPYCRRSTWTGAMIRRLYRNPLLKGQPGRGFRKTIKRHETGRRIQVLNPDGPHYRDCPNLAFFDAAEFDELNALITKRNAHFRRPPKDGVDPLFRIPRKRTRFPGQHARCWYCGRQFVWGGNGVAPNLMCSGSREWKCWHSVGFSGTLASARIRDVILAQLYALEGFEEQFAALVQSAERDVAGFAQRRAALRKNEEALSREKNNLLAAIAEFGPKDMFREQLVKVDERERDLARERSRLERMQADKPRLPQSASELRRPLEEQFLQLSVDSYEFGDLLRQLVPEMHVYSVRLLDSGRLMPRARVRLNLAGCIAGAEQFPELEQSLTRLVTIDLFDPPQRERIRPEAVRLAASGLKQREVAARIAEQPTLPAVQRALKLEAMMNAAGLASPYQLATVPRDDYPKFRRHLNPKFKFEPLEGYEPPPL